MRDYLGVYDTQMKNVCTKKNKNKNWIYKGCQLA